MASQRIEDELELLKVRHPDLEFVEEGLWVKLPGINLPQGWSPGGVDILFQFKSGYPQEVFYGFFTPTGMLINEVTPQNYTNVAEAQPPFPGTTWAFFSGNPDPWQPKAEIQSGSNVLTWVQSIHARFMEKL
ncbi:MAG: hypothetical protein H7Y17_12215 [Chlorobia bacterium]|nr:hypothetical protein [Fimbriimonadaceae bacterium]